LPYSVLPLPAKVPGDAVNARVRLGRRAPGLSGRQWVADQFHDPPVAGLIVTIRDFADDLSPDRLGGIYPATFLFVYICFLVLGVAFGVTAWLTRRNPAPDQA
jgi:hypothetical protein